MEVEPIEHPWVSRSIESAQKKVEGMHFDARKHVVEYDDVMNKQRQIVYEERAKVLEGADALLEPGAPFHIHFSDIQYANRNETKHLPYGEGTLRAEPLGDALARFDRPATVISESPDEKSHQAIRAALEAALAPSRRRSKASASSSRPRSRSS